MRNPYQMADRAIRILDRKAIRRFEKAKSTLSRSRFDELNIVRTVNALYKDLDKDSREVFTKMAQEQYKAVEPAGNHPPTPAWLAALLLIPSDTMLYAFQPEALRKRDRLSESLTASSAKSREMEKALRYWARMVGWFADEISDKATIESFKDAGVKKVKWNTNMDGRECEICKKRNGKIYPIGQIPPKPHPGCRCWFTAVIENK